MSSNNSKGIEPSLLVKNCLLRKTDFFHLPVFWKFINNVLIMSENQDVKKDDGTNNKLASIDSIIQHHASLKPKYCIFVCQKLYVVNFLVLSMLKESCIYLCITSILHQE